VASNEETVNGLWKGLGYYSRAARLLLGAQTVVEKYGGHLPEDPAVLEKQIAGIGKYTAGAITSIAYGVCAPVVRLLHLLFLATMFFPLSGMVIHSFSLAGWKR
jgi:adenine-specific DNA glycosylase